MKKIYLLLSTILVVASFSCNKPTDYSELSIVNLRGTYKVVYEAQEFIDQNGDLVVNQACNTEDIVVISPDFFTWMVGNGRCPSKDYYENWPYYITKESIYIFSTNIKVEYWDGQTLRMVSSDDPSNGRYVLELIRN